MEAPPNTLGNRIRQLRLNHAPAPYKLTLKGLGKLTGISHSYLCQLETGKCNDPSAYILFEIAQALNTTVEYLLTGETS